MTTQRTDDRPPPADIDDDGGDLWLQVSCSRPEPDAPVWWVALGRGEDEVVTLAHGLSEAQARQLRDRVAAILRLF